MRLLAFLFIALSQAAFAAVTPTVRVDQIGYLSNESKLGMIVSAPTGNVDVRRATDSVSVLNVAASAGAADSASGDMVRIVDFSSVTTTGSYYLDVPGVGQSYSFSISPNVFNATWRTAMRGFHVQRCGTAVDMSPDFPAYTHAACHLSDANFHTSSGKTGSKTATMGWHDAGDYGKYTTNAAIAVGELLWCFEHYGSTVAGVNLNIPESGNGTPDLLNEVKWELDWMLTMQDTDGGLWQKLTSTGFGSFVLPENDDASSPRVIIGTGSSPYKNSSSTGGFAAVMAIAARDFQPYNPAYAATCLSASTAAYAWVKANPNVNSVNPTGITTGEYGGVLPSYQLWAAAELLRTTGNTSYRTDFEGSKGATPYVTGVQDWTNVRNLAMWAYAQSASATTATVTQIISDTVTDANTMLTNRGNNGYRNTMTNGNYIWGSNGVDCNSGLLLMMANRLSPNANYVQAALDDLHYILGRNCFDTCWVTQVGTLATLHPHHRPSGSPEYVNLPPWPGLMSGGPDGTAGDKDGIVDSIPSNPPMKRWTDQTMAYCVNEIALNWQAPLVYLLAACMPTSSPTPTPSITPSRTPSGTSTATGTRTATATGTRTASATPSVSPSSTASATGSSTATSSASSSPSPTATASPTRTATASATPCPTGTMSGTASPSRTATGTDTEGPSPSSSITPSATPTASTTHTGSSTSSATPSATPPPTSTAISTSTESSTASPTPSFTTTAVQSTPSQTRTITPGPSPTSSVTPTASPTSTPTLTAMAEPSASASATALAQAGPVRIIKVLGFPNPQPGAGHIGLEVQLLGSPQSLVAKVYSRNLVLAAAGRVTGGLRPGWNIINIPVAALPGGTYFVLLSAEGGGGKDVGKPVALVVRP